MKPIRSIALAAAVLAMGAAFAAEKEKRLFPAMPGAGVCQPGEALTFTLQCDPGSRSFVGRIWAPAAPGAELCKVSQPRCAPIPFVNPNARPGFEVQDSPVGSLVFVGFGLGRLLDIEP